MAAADALRTFLADLLPDWRVQYGRWMDDSKTSRYCVIRPVGGLPVSLVREPQFTLTFIGQATDSTQTISASVEAVISEMQTSSAGLVFVQPSEPVFVPTSDGRPMFDLAVSAILNS